jgi:hypothetical protein
MSFLQVLLPSVRTFCLDPANIEDSNVAGLRNFHHINFRGWLIYRKHQSRYRPLIEKE